MRIPLARFISILAHPFVLIVLLTFLPRFQTDASDAIRRTASVVAIALAPIGVLMWRCYASGQWKTIDASAKADRPVLYASLLAVLFLLGIYFHRTDHSGVLVRGTLCGFLMIAVAFALNHWIKLSLHLAFACFCGVVLTYVDPRYGVPILVLLPFLGWSRLVLSRHSVTEVFAGAALGLVAAIGFLSSKT